MMGHYQADNGAPLGTVRLAAHPTDMVWRAGKVETAEGERRLWRGCLSRRRILIMFTPSA